jgi:AcrR family transcriptional regulator
MNVRLTAVREQTKKTIELAIKRIQQGAPRIVEKRTKLSIAAVAREAGVSNATIHNRYPDLANKIRELMHNTVINIYNQPHNI